jgi:hypothetical protein
VDRKKLSNGDRFVFVDNEADEAAWRAKGYAEAGPSAIADNEKPAPEAEKADAKAAEEAKSRVVVEPPPAPKVPPKGKGK